jgi:FAD/FMN-containing dehydrogenase
MGKYGLTIDNLLSAQVVTASGEVVMACSEENEDLFRALRGVAGNFGIVTSFEYQAHRVPSVHGGMVAHPVSRAGAALDFFRHFTREAPGELTAYFSLFASPGQPAEKLAAIPAENEPDTGWTGSAVSNSRKEMRHDRLSTGPDRGQLRAARPRRRVASPLGPPGHGNVIPPPSPLR